MNNIDLHIKKIKEELGLDVTLKQMRSYPLLEHGYKPVECEECKKLCFPSFLLQDGRVRYNVHKCLTKSSSFAIKPKEH